MEGGGNVGGPRLADQEDRARRGRVEHVAPNTVDAARVRSRALTRRAASRRARRAAHGAPTATAALRGGGAMRAPTAEAAADGAGEARRRERACERPRMTNFHANFIFERVCVLVAGGGAVRVPIYSSRAWQHGRSYSYCTGRTQGTCSCRLQYIQQYCTAYSVLYILPVSGETLSPL